MKIIKANIIDHNMKLIVIPEEKLKGSPISDFSEVETEAGEQLKIIQRVTIAKGEIMPSSLMLLATGQDIHGFEIWHKYKKSKLLYFLICELKPIEQ